MKFSLIGLKKRGMINKEYMVIVFLMSWDIIEFNICFVCFIFGLFCLKFDFGIVTNLCF